MAARELPPPGISHGSADVWLEGAGAGPNISASSRMEDCEQKGNKKVKEAQGRPARLTLESNAGCVAIHAVPGFSSSFLLPPLPPCLRQSPPWLSASESSPLAMSSPPAGTRDRTHKTSNLAASTFSRRQTQHRSCHRIPEKSQHLSRRLLWGQAHWKNAQQTAQSSESKADTRVRQHLELRHPKEKPKCKERSTQGYGAQVPSHAPLCSAQALAAIAFLHLYWKLEKVASANRGNGVTFQLALSS